MNDFLIATDLNLARMIFERFLGLIYFVGFLSAYNQFPALLGERGLLPTPEYLKLTTFWDSPGLFHWKYSDFFLRAICLIGMILSILISIGVIAKGPILLHMFTWLTVYFLYLSIVNVGQDFYSFGWETMLLEAGFFAAFMGPEWIAPSWIPIIILRWMLFRTEMGAGLIKLRGDSCWRDLTCLYFHHETQPLPNPISRYFHHLPKCILRWGVLYSHFCQLIVPFGLFVPGPISFVSGLLLISHQSILVISGNYSWLNWLTIVLGFLTFSVDSGTHFSATPMWFSGIQLGVLFGTICLSYRPLLNLFSPTQYMNYCWNRWHLVGTYGAFGSVTKRRFEIVIEGTDSHDPLDESRWKEYWFKGKPVELNRAPPIVAPYHLRLDWMIWFLPFTVVVRENSIDVRGHRLYFIRLMLRLLENDQQLLKLFRFNPFNGQAPSFVRAKFYHYQFTTTEEKKLTGNTWKRAYLGEFCPEISLYTGQE